MSRITFETDDLTLLADIAQPIDLAIPLDFNGAQPNCFGAPRATRVTFEVGGWVGDTRRGGSCNVNALQLNPHCNGTHTECVGHIVDDPVHAAATLRGGLLPATLIRITPEPAETTAETSLPAPKKGDRLVTAAAIRQALDRFPEQRLRHALVIRSQPAGAEVNFSYDAADPPPYLTREAAQLLVDMNVEHLLIDLPSIDRMADEGRLTAHRIFFGLPAASRRAQDATRARCTVTELIHVPEAAADGYYLLDLQMPSFLTDAAPSRPLLYKAIIQ